jgi:hypothetical protein
VLDKFWVALYGKNETKERKELIDFMKTLGIH